MTKIIYQESKKKRQNMLAEGLPISLVAKIAKLDEKEIEKMKNN